jgi:hypothetical protein
MSFTIAIVIPPVPADNAEAWDALDALIELEGATPEVFQQLHARLTARYPCMSSLPEDQVDEAVWSDGPLINNFGHRAAVLGMSYHHVEEVLPFLITTANGLGLVVFDWETETIHRPGSTGMTLQLESGKLIKNVTEADLRRYLEGEEFAILAVDDDTYMQCAEQQDRPYEYVLEYQDGSLHQHYRAVDEPITQERVLAAMAKYLRGDASWRDEFEWEKVDLS